MKFQNWEYAFYADAACKTNSSGFPQALEIMENLENH